MRVGPRIVLAIALLGLSCALALFVCLPVFSGLQQQHETIVARDAEIRLNSTVLRELVHSRNAARHAYLITGRLLDREEYVSAQRAWDIALAAGRGLVASDSRQRQRLDSIDHAMHQVDRTSGAAEFELGDLRREGREVDPVLAARLVSEGNERAIEIASMLDQFDSAQASAMDARIRAAREYAERARARIGAAAIGILVVAAFIAMSLLAGFRAPLVELTRMAQSIAVGKHRKIGWERRDELGDLGRAIEQMSEALGEREHELRQRSALISLDARMGTVLNQAHDVKAVSDGSLKLLAEALGAFAGALFVTDGQGKRFVCEATLGTTRESVTAAGIEPGEGLLGRVVQSGQGFCVRPARDEAPRVATAVAEIPAAAYLVYPIGQADNVIGVIELACAHEPDKALIQHLDALIDQLGVALANAIVARERDKLLERLEAQYAELHAREERLLAQSEKLDAQARELGRKNDELQAVNQNKSQFIATMSHELRTPLNGILGFTELLLERSRTLSKDDRDTLQEVRNAGRHLLSLINDILDLARIGAGRLGLRRTNVPVGTIAREVLDVMRPAAGAKKIALDVVAAPELTVDADPSRLRQILLNLVGNAVKFTDVGSVRIRALTDRDRVRIEVTDTGPGISGEDRAKLFREFSQIDRSGRRHEGSGLGLAIARELVLAHGGDIGVESEPGRGSTFWFTLSLGTAMTGDAVAKSQDEPYSVAAHSTRVPQSPSLGPGAGNGAGTADTAVPSSNDAAVNRDDAPVEARRVLLVEDHPRNARLVEAMLAGDNYRIEHVSDGERAVTRALEAPPAVVLLDLELPGIDGFEVARRLRADVRTAQVPIIAVTARVMPAEEARARAIGCTDFITKPIDMTLLRRAIRSALGLRVSEVEIGKA